MKTDSDRQLDSYITGNLKEDTFQYNPDAWDQMEALLEEKKRKRVLWLFVRGSVGILLLAAIISPFVIWNLSDPKLNTPETTVIRKPANEQNKTSTPPDSEKINLNAQENSPKPVFDGAEIKKLEVGENPSAIKNRRIIGVDRNTKIVESVIESNKVEVDDAVQPTIPDSDPMPDFPKQKEKDSINREQLPPKQNRVVEAEKDSLDEKTNDQSNSVAGGDSSKRKRPLWAISPAIGIESNALNAIEGYGRPSLQVGFYLRASLSKKITFVTGINYNKKSYVAGMGQYNPPAGFWTIGIPPVSTEGHCNIVELPLGFEYYKNGMNKDGFSFSIGLSSYLLLKEEYFYTYSVQSSLHRQEWKTDQGSKHFFGIGRFSINYQKHLNPKNALMIGPYMQVPFLGIGKGNVSLFSMGAQLQYNLWMY